MAKAVKLCRALAGNYLQHAFSFQIFYLAYGSGLAAVIFKLGLSMALFGVLVILHFCSFQLRLFIFSCYGFLVFAYIIY